MTTLADGRYVLDEPLASGGMGEVWRGTDTALGRRVAIKLLRPQLADDPSFRQRFATEARNAAALHDPRIATVFDYGDELDPSAGRHRTYLVMELVDGKPLSDLLTAPFSPDRAAELVAQVAEGLAVAHAAGIVHRDVKPANFLVTPDGRVKITDFGIARAAGAASLTDPGTLVGTPHYLAPEVVEGREATPRSDLYSLGVVLYETLTASKPFTGDTPVAVAMAHLRQGPRPLPTSVPPRLQALVESALAKDPAQRPPDAATFAAELRAAVGAGQAPTVVAAAPPAGASRTRVLPAAAIAPAVTPDMAYGDERRRRWWPTAAAAVVLLAGLALVFALTRGDEPDPTAGRGADANAGTSTRTPPTSATASDSASSDSATSATTAASTPASTPPSTPTTSTAPAGIVVDPDDYIGTDAKDAKERLEDAGLRVEEEKVEGDGEKDTVAAVEPSGTLQPGDRVTLSVWQGPQGSDDPGKGEDKSDDSGKGG